MQYSPQFEPDCGGPWGFRVRLCLPDLSLRVREEKPKSVQPLYKKSRSQHERRRMLSPLRPLSHERAQSYVTWSKNEFFILGGSQQQQAVMDSPRREMARNGEGPMDGRTRTGDKEGAGRVLTHFAFFPIVVTPLPPPPHSHSHSGLFTCPTKIPI